MARHCSLVELDVVIEPDPVRWPNGYTLDERLREMVAPPAYVDPDTDRTSCHVAEEVWFEPSLGEVFSGYYGCGTCGQPTRPIVEYQVVLEEGPTGWPLVAFHGDTAYIEPWLHEHGFTDGLETYAVEEVH